MQTTDKFGLKLYEGKDLFNPLTVENDNMQSIATQMEANQSGTVGVANQLLTGSVHAITRITPNASMFRFTATSRFTKGDSFTVDGVSVTALMPNGTAIPDGAFVIGSTVLCSLVGQLLTIYSYGVAEAEDSKKLGGKLPNYYGTKTEVDNAKALANSAATIAQESIEKVGNIGIIYKKAESINLASGNNGSIITSLQLPIGKYIIFYKGNFAGNSNGLRALLFDTTTSVASFNGTYYDSINSATGNSSTIISDFRIVEISNATTFYLSACQNSGSTLGTHGSIFAVKVG